MKDIPLQTLENRNITVTNPETGEVRRTSIRLEKLEWEAARQICQRGGYSIHEFCNRVETDPARNEHSRTSRIRTAILRYFMKLALPHSRT